MKSLGEVKQYLGIEVSKDEDNSYAICQTSYIVKIAEEFQLENCKGSKYPMDTGYHKINDETLLDSNEMYRKLIGMLLYISTNTRPDISASVGILSQRVSKPRNVDLNEGLRIVRYLTATKDLKLKMFDKKETITLQAFADADFAEFQTRKSISGVICKVYGGTVYWMSKKQDLVSLSTTEAEFYALTEGIKELMWLKYILQDFDITTEAPLIIHSDNQSTIKLVESSKFSNRTKHIDLRLHFVRDNVAKGNFKVIYIPTDINLADLLTKPLAGPKISQLRQLAGLN